MIHNIFIVLFNVLLLTTSMANAQPTTTISIAHTEAEFNTSVNVPVTTTGIPSFVILQLRIAFNPEVMTFTGIANRHASLGGMSVGEQDGVVNFSFFTGSSRSIGHGQKLFDLKFDFCTDFEGCLAAGGSSDLSFFGGKEENYIQDFDDDFIDYVTTTVDGSVYSNTSVYTLTVNKVGNGQVYVDEDPYTEAISFVGSSSVSLEALAADGWLFDKWTGDLSGSDNPAVLLMNDNKMVTAHFEELIPPPQYTLTVLTVGNGTVNIDGIPYTQPVTVNEGTVLNLEAFAEFGWHFDNWSGNIEGSTNPTSITMDGDKEVTVTFSEIPTYTLTVHVVGSGSVTADGTTYTSEVVAEENQVLQLEAIPDAGWRFDSWSGHIEGSTNPASIIMDGDKEVTVTFSKIPTYTLTLNIVGNGAITVNGVPYSDPITVLEGTILNLAADPEHGWKFDDWSGALTGTTTPQSLTMNSDKEVTATFSEIPTYTLTLHVVGSGSVTVDGTTYTSEVVTEENQVLQLEAIPNAGWRFDNWSGHIEGSTNPTSITMDGNKEVTVTFSKIPTYTLTLNIVGNGAVTVNGVPYSDPITVLEGTIFNLAADPEHGWKFDGWSGAITETTTPQSLTMNSDKEVTATFTIKTYTLTIITSGTGSVDVDGVAYSGQLILDHGTTPSLEAIPGDFHNFSGWSGSISGTENPKSITMDGNKTVTASFTPFQYTLTLHVTGGGSVSVNGTTYSTPITFNHGENPSLLAVTPDGWDFEGWSGDITGMTNPQNIFIDGDKVVTATFSIKQYTLTINTSGNGTVLVNGDTYTEPMVFDHGDTPQLLALADDNSLFNVWSGNLTGITNPQNLMMNGDKSVTANFALKQYTLTLNITGNGTVMVDGITYNGPLFFDHGTIPSLEAIANDFHSFNGWSGDLTGMINPQNLEMTGNKIVNASFSPFQYTLDINTIGNGSVTVDGVPYSGQIILNHGDTPAIQAFGGNGWHFNGWTGDLTSTSNPANILMDENKGITANFELNQYTLSINTSGNGTVLVNGTTYTGPMLFTHGDTPSIQALAGDFHNFSGWGGALAGMVNPQSLSIDGNKTVQANFTPFQYTLDISVIGQGHVEVNGTPYTIQLVFNHGDMPSLRAFANANWQFDGWSGNLTGTTNPQNLLMDGNKSVTASFSEIPPEFFALTVTINGSGSVTVNDLMYTSPIGFEEGTLLNLEAIPDPGWSFTGWTGAITGTEIDHSLVLNDNISVTATFESKQYTLTAAHTGSGEVWVEGVKYTEPITFTFEDTPLIEAIPAEGYLFDGWSGDLSGHENPAGLTMDGDKAVEAHFVLIPPSTFTLTIATQGSGSVRVNDITYTDPLPFEEQSEVILEAVPDEGWLFDGWSGDLGGHENPNGLTMDGDKAVEAHFVLIPPSTFTLTIATQGSGSVLVNDITYTDPLPFEEQSEVMLEAVPDEGWLFDGWSGDLGGHENPNGLTMDGDKAVEAHFVLIPPSTFTLTIATQGSGSVRVNDITYTDPLPFEEQTEVMLEAVPDEGWLFDGWSGDLSGHENPTGLTMDGDKAVEAHFVLIPPSTFTLTIATQGSGSVRVNDITYTDPLPFEEQTEVMLEAVPDEGWLFDGWSGDLSGHENPTGLTMDGDKAVEAHFVLIPPSTFTLTIATQGSGSVRVNDITYTDPLPFEEQTEVMLEAVPDEGWLFDGWSGELGGHENPTGLTMDGPKTITATFTEIPPPTFSVTFIVGTTNGTPIHDAAITISDIAYPAGEYLISELLAGEYHYTVSREGYFNTTGMVTVTNANLIEVVIMTLDDTSIADKEELQFQAYPNPATDRVVIESNREMTRIELMNVFGQLVIETTPDDHFYHQLSLNSLPKGMYLLLIHTQGERRTIQLQVMP